MPERKYSAQSSYRYGFNGKEMDDEVSGQGNEYDYGFRIYNPRLGRFLSVDPLTQKYPWYTPYQFAGNKPTQCVDIDGQEESVPYLQSAAFDRMEGADGSTYVRGKKGDKLAVNLPDDRSSFEKFLESISPIKIAPLKPAPHIAQAMNFAQGVGTVVYDYDKFKVGEIKSITNSSEGVHAGNHTVFLNISGYSEVGQEIRKQLRSSYGLSELSEGEIADYISSVDFLFTPGSDYSNLFWLKTDLKPTILLNQIGPTTIPLSPSTPILMPPSGVSTSSDQNSDLVINTEALSSEIAQTLAPSLVQMAEHKKNARPSTEEKHQKGQSRTKQDREGSKGMKNPPRKRPPGHKGPWPPKNK